MRRTPDNATRVYAALEQFGAPLAALDIRESYFTKKDLVCQLGVPPRRIDLLTDISGLTFEEAWRTHETQRLTGYEIALLGRDALITNKLASGRTKDLTDVESLRGDRLDPGLTARRIRTPFLGRSSSMPRPLPFRRPRKSRGAASITAGTTPKPPVRCAVNISAPPRDESSRH